MRLHETRALSEFPLRIQIKCGDDDKDRSQYQRTVNDTRSRISLVGVGLTPRPRLTKHKVYIRSSHKIN